MKIYNTLTRKKEDFKTIEEKKCRIYVCGPTVYDYIHIGNARPMIVFDTFRRYLTFMGYDVNYVSNFTDIDDKIINRANELHISSEELATKYIEECKKDMNSMNILPATTHPLATKEIDGMIELISKLIEKGYAYVASDGTVYYDTKKFEGYGKLSHKVFDELLSGQRELKVTGEDNKKNLNDFVLWKPKKEGEPYWESPWCLGRPGWHTECCVMAPKYCNGALDIHAGGEDLVFPHHENEIAQYEPLYGEPYARYWMHNAFLNINGQKMSKSLNNFYTVRDVLNRYEGRVLRLLMLETHYRAMLNFSFDLMDSAKIALERIDNCIESLEFIINKNNLSNRLFFKNYDELNKALEEIKNNNLNEIENEYVNKLTQYIDLFISKLNDDFNTADAITQIFEIVKLANLNKDKLENKNLLVLTQNILITFLNVLGIKLKDENINDDDYNEINKLIEERNTAKKNKDFKLADEIRDKIKSLGYEIEDTRQGTKCKKI